MRIKLLVATYDTDYSEHLSDALSKDYSDAVDVSVCSTSERLGAFLDAQNYDVALLDSSMAVACDLKAVFMPVQLWTEEDAVKGEAICNEIVGIKKVRKYQRISSLLSTILESYAEVSTENSGVDFDKASITAVWSPAGGVGKTTVALAYAARRVSEGRRAVYLDLEPFSSVPAYFTENGTSVSTVFDMLESGSGNIKMLLKGIVRLDSSAGIGYFCCPDNYDDINILSSDDISSLITACSSVTDELVVDLYGACDDRARRIFELADSILLVTDNSSAAKTKLSQFVTQNNVYNQIKGKTIIVANKGASVTSQPVACAVSLPLIQSEDVNIVYRTLAAGL